MIAQGMGRLRAGGLRTPAAASPLPPRCVLRCWRAGRGGVTDRGGGAAMWLGAGRLGSSPARTRSHALAGAAMRVPRRAQLVRLPFRAPGRARAPPASGAGALQCGAVPLCAARRAVPGRRRLPLRELAGACARGGRRARGRGAVRGVVGGKRGTRAAAEPGGACWMAQRLRYSAIVILGRRPAVRHARALCARARIATLVGRPICSSQTDPTAATCRRRPHPAPLNQTHAQAHNVFEQYLVSQVAVVTWV